MSRTLFRLAAIAIIVAGVSCGTERTGPEALYSEDICDRCRMSITEVRMAAQVRLDDGSVLKYDDIGCMMRDPRRARAVASYVMDFVNQTWLSADTARFVKSEELTTPMGYGLVAVGDDAAVDSLSREFSGERITFKSAIHSLGGNR